MHVRALAWWRCPLCSASYGISPFCTAFPHLQPYFFFKHPRRRCPALGSRCDNESSAKEPVRAPFGWGGGGGGALGGAAFSRGSGCMGGVLCGGCGQASLVQHFPSAPSRPAAPQATRRPACTQVIVTASVVQITHPVAPINAPDCGNQPNADCQINKGSMPCKMIETACTPKLEGEVVATDETGTATFSSLAIRSGPAATYLLRFDGADGVSTHSLVSVAPRVSVIMPQDPQVGVNMHVEPGVPFATQPKVLLLGEDDKPVKNAIVTVFASENLNYFQDFRRESDKASRSAGTALHHPRGQNYALLSGDVSLPSDENGIAEFTNVTLIASSSKYLYLMFYCDGAVASWNNPQLTAPSPGAVGSARALRLSHLRVVAYQAGCRPAAWWHGLRTRIVRRSRSRGAAGRHRRRAATADAARPAPRCRREAGGWPARDCRAAHVPRRRPAWSGTAANVAPPLVPLRCGLNPYPNSGPNIHATWP